MKSKYRGYDLEVVRDNCMAGYPLLYYSIFKDGEEIDNSFEDSEETVRGKLKQLKKEVDMRIEFPELYEENGVI